MNLEEKKILEKIIKENKDNGILTILKNALNGYEKLELFETLNIFISHNDNDDLNKLINFSFLINSKDLDLQNEVLEKINNLINILYEIVTDIRQSKIKSIIQKRRTSKSRTSKSMMSKSMMPKSRTSKSMMSKSMMSKSMMPKSIKNMMSKRRMPKSRQLISVVGGDGNNDDDVSYYNSIFILFVFCIFLLTIIISKIKNIKEQLIQEERAIERKQAAIRDDNDEKKRFARFRFEHAFGPNGHSFFRGKLLEDTNWVNQASEDEEIRKYFIDLVEQNIHLNDKIPRKLLGQPDVVEGIVSIQQADNNLFEQEVANHPILAEFSFMKHGIFLSEDDIYDINDLFSGDKIKSGQKIICIFNSLNKKYNIYLLDSFLKYTESFNGGPIKDISTSAFYINSNIQYGILCIIDREINVPSQLVTFIEGGSKNKKKYKKLI